MGACRGSRTARAGFVPGRRRFGIQGRTRVRTGGRLRSGRIEHGSLSSTGQVLPGNRLGCLIALRPGLTPLAASFARRPVRAGHRRAIPRTAGGHNPFRGIYDECAAFSNLAHVKKRASRISSRGGCTSVAVRATRSTPGSTRTSTTLSSSLELRSGVTGTWRGARHRQCPRPGPTPWRAEPRRVRRPLVLHSLEFPSLPRGRRALVAELRRREGFVRERTASRTSLRGWRSPRPRAAPRGVLDRTRPRHRSPGRASLRVPAGATSASLPRGPGVDVGGGYRRWMRTGLLMRETGSRRPAPPRALEGSPRRS